ncbi:MAG: efflux RND transporter periplasmic adaptor subunit [Gemmatimonadales bacterium]|nr:efflux RND transporter periplasmic adaptor subunit [Gemmatimonadales bacterium]
MLSSMFSPFAGGKAWRRLIIAVAIAGAFGIGLNFRGGREIAPAEAGHEHSRSEKETVWTCSMHPQIKLPKAGQCPLCFMDLIPLETEAEDGLGPRSLVLSEAAAALAEIQTAVVQERIANSRIRLIGKVDYDETLLRMISARVPGRIDTLFVDFTGATVAKGDRLVSLYSPDLYATQTELLNAVRAKRNFGKSRNDFIRKSAVSTVQSARERLKLWGLTDSRIDRIAKSDKALEHIDIISPLDGVVVEKAVMEGMYVKTGTNLYTVADLSRVWVTLNAYESDLIWLKEGQTIDFTVEALPGHEFAGEILFIDPVLDTRTRTVRVRIDVDNRKGLLKPGLFVNATAKAGFDTIGPSAPLVIPATAPLITGERAVVYVRVPDTAKPTFEGREIILGPRVGDYYVVKSGLMSGDVVVTKGNFKLDSALQIQARPSMMNPQSGRPTLEVAEEFRLQLGNLLQAYLEVQAALADDNDSGSEAAARQANQALAAVDMDLLTGEAHHAWMSEAAGLKASFTSLVEANDLESRRNALLPATESLWPILLRFGYTESEPIRLFHCPMANDNAGADWIQMPSTTTNPYYGSSMLLCGSQIDSLATSESGEGM